MLSPSRLGPTGSLLSARSPALARLFWTQPPGGWTSPFVLPKKKPRYTRLQEEKSKDLSSIGELVFSGEGVPPLRFWVTKLPYSGAKKLTAVDCAKAAAAYCDGTRRRTREWSYKLQREHNITPYVLHYMGLMLTDWPQTSYDFYALGLNMLGTAQTFGYTPSTLQLVIMWQMMSKRESFKSRQPAIIREAVANFRQLVRGKRDADALTLQGRFHVQEGETSEALEMFDHAVRVGSVKDAGTGGATGSGDAAAQKALNTQSQFRSPRWYWEASCHVGRGRILLSQGRREEAEQSFRIAALELDNDAGYFGLANLLSEDSPERKEYLLKAAASGNLEAASLIGKLEEKMASQPGLGARDAEKHRLLAAEWARVADVGQNEVAKVA